MNDECRQKLIAGVNLAADVAAITFGPKGHNVICGEHVTKDGMTAVSWIQDEDPFVMTGVNLMKSIAKRTAAVAGDNTTTAMLLTRNIVTNCQKEDIPLLKDGLNKVLDYLKDNKRTVKTEQDLANIATLAANGDNHLGELVASAFYRLGDEGIVTFSESEDVLDRVEYTEGFRIDNGFSSPLFVNTPTGACELNDVYVHISDTKMEEIKEVVEIADMCVKKGKSLLLMAPGFDSEIYVFLSSNLNLLKSCTVISPSYRNYRDILVKDIKVLLGDSHICKKVILTPKHTTFSGYTSSDSASERIEEIREIVKANELPEYEMDFHKKRLANFVAGIATIYIGGYSQAEIKEKLDRIEDSIRATECAVKGGILPGGGITLAKASELLENTHPLKSSLLLPMQLLGTNLSQKNEMIRSGIIEPYLVVKTALENAINTASMILTCDCVILPTNNY